MQGEETENRSPRVGHLVKEAQLAIRAEMENALGPCNLTLAQFKVIEHLSRHPGDSNADLARAGFVTAQSMQSILARLESAGLIERKPDPKGGRRLISRLTPAGRDVLEQACACVAPVEQAVIEAIAPLDPEPFCAALIRIRDQIGA